MDRGTRVSKYYSQRNQILKKKWRGGGGGGRGVCVCGGGRWMDRRTGLNQFAPSTSSKLGV